MYGKDNLMYDLHGMSESEAAALVGRVIRETSASVTVRLRFVTGRGNHINSKGQRGTLFKQFPEWLKQSPYADRVEKVVTFDGHYEVFIKSTLLDNSFQAKLKRFNERFYAENIDVIRADADGGNPEAMVLYGQLIESGEYGKQDLKVTAAYFKKAAEENHPEGMHEYARCWLHGIGVRQSDEKAKEWLIKASNKGYIPSTVTLAKKYANGMTAYPRDLNEAIRLHTICAEAGETDSMRFFGSYFFTGEVVEPCLPLAFSWYLRAAELGDAKAQYNVAVMCAQGRGTELDLQKADHYYKLAAYNGDVDGQFVYAMTLMKSPDKKIKEQGLIWLFAAADNGSEHANEKLSCLLPPDEAREYLVRSAQAGNFFSQRKLNILNGKPENFDITLEAIIAKFRSLTEYDILHMAQDAKYFILDKVLLDGPAKDKRSAFNIIKYMAEQNCTYAIRRESYFYARGDGVLEIKKDAEHLLKLLQKASALGDPISIVQLACHYLKKNDDPKMIAEAKKLFRQAADKKYPPAFFELGLLYHRGAFGANNKHHALQCFQSAVKYEKTKDHVQLFALGPIDEYESVEPNSQRYIDQIVASGGVASKTSSIISTGFFNKPQGAAPAPIPTRQEELPQKSHHGELDQNASTSDIKEPVTTPQSSPQPVVNGLWSFFTPSTVVVAASVVALTVLAFK